MAFNFNKYNIDWNYTTPAPITGKGIFNVEICFFDHTAFIGRTDFVSNVQGLKYCCEIIEGVSLDEIFDVYERSFWEIEGDIEFTSIAFEISQFKNGINYLIAETGMYLPNY